MIKSKTTNNTPIITVLQLLPVFNITPVSLKLTGTIFNMSFNEFEGIPIKNGVLQDKFKNESPPIGCGRFGIVVKATKKDDNQDYAIKKVIIRSKVSNFTMLI